MAKRYYGSVTEHPDKFNDEKKHNKAGRGAAAGFRAEGPESYGDYGSRRTMEMQDAGMIRENPNAIANLPQEVMIKAYPKNGPYMPSGLNDTIEGVDAQMDYDDSQRAAHFFPKKV